MTILTALATLYDRMKEADEAPPPGYSNEKIGGEVVLDAAGKVLDIRRQGSPNEKNKWVPNTLAVPAAVKRASGIKPNMLWDKTAYVLGVTALKDGNGKPILDEDGHPIAGQEKRTGQEHEAFRKSHADLLADSDDAGLVALRSFLEKWRPDEFAERRFPPEVLDKNVVFRFVRGTSADGFIHDRPAAIKLLGSTAGGAGETLCLVTGEYAPVARLHPSIKGVMGAQSSGASLVAFNSAAYESLGKQQGDNAPVSQAAAFAYGTALNTLLARDSGHTLRIGGATVVFWAETPERKKAKSIEQMLFGAFDPPDDDAECNKLKAALEAVAKGRAAQGTEFDPDTRVYFLGLAPNAARLSVRFWQPGSFGDFARHITAFWDDLALEPSPWKTAPAAWSLLLETALQRKAENIPPRLGGDLMCAVLTGAPYPRTLLSGVINRIRADGDINGRRAAICRAVINQNTKREEIPMSLDRDNRNPAYRLGRMFAVLESIQQAALPGLNATIRDRYFASASATPARIFPQLTKNATHHLSLLRKGDSGGLAHWLDREMGDIWGGLEADLPRALNLEDQGRFVAGYYHQRRPKKTTEGTDAPQDDVIETGSIEQ